MLFHSCAERPLQRGPNATRQGYFFHVSLQNVVLKSIHTVVSEPLSKAVHGLKVWLVSDFAVLDVSCSSNIVNIRYFCGTCCQRFFFKQFTSLSTTRRNDLKKSTLVFLAKCVLLSVKCFVPLQTSCYFFH